MPESFLQADIAKRAQVWKFDRLGQISEALGKLFVLSINDKMGLGLLLEGDRTQCILHTWHAIGVQYM